MKKLLVSLIKAALYTAAFLIIQVAVTLGLTLITSLVSGVLFFSMGIYDPGYLLTDNLLSIVTVVSSALTLLFFLIFFGVRGKKFSREVRWHKLASPGYAMLGPLECGFGLSLLSSFALAMIPFPEAWYAAYDETMELMLVGNPLFLAAATVLADTVPRVRNPCVPSTPISRSSAAPRRRAPSTLTPCALCAKRRIFSPTKRPCACSFSATRRR